MTVVRVHKPLLLFHVLHSFILKSSFSQQFSMLLLSEFRVTAVSNEPNTLFNLKIVNLFLKNGPVTLLIHSSILIHIINLEVTPSVCYDFTAQPLIRFE